MLQSKICMGNIEHLKTFMISLYESLAIGGRGRVCVCSSSFGSCMPLHCDFHDCHFLGAIKDNPRVLTLCTYFAFQGSEGRHHVERCSRAHLKPRTVCDITTCEYLAITTCDSEIWPAGYKRSIGPSRSTLHRKSLAMKVFQLIWLILKIRKVYITKN